MNRAFVLFGVLHYTYSIHEPYRAYLVSLILYFPERISVTTSTSHCLADGGSSTEKTRGPTSFADFPESLSR